MLVSASGSGSGGRGPWAYGWGRGPVRAGSAERRERLARTRDVVGGGSGGHVEDAAPGAPRRGTLVACSATSVTVAPGQTHREPRVVDAALCLPGTPPPVGLLVRVRDDQRAEAGRDDLGSDRGRRSRSAPPAPRACDGSSRDRRTRSTCRRTCAISRSVLRSPPPPTRIGGPPGWTGCGTLIAPSMWWTAALERRLRLREHRSADPERVLQPLEPLGRRRPVVAVGAGLLLVPRRADARGSPGPTTRRRAS